VRSYGLLFHLVDQDPGLGEQPQPRPVRRPEIRQENRVDLLRPKSRPLVKPGRQRRRRQTRVNQERLFARSNQRARRVRRANRLGFAPKPVAA